MLQISNRYAQEILVATWHFICDDKRRAVNMQKISLLLLDIRSVHNVGSIFRTADAAGVECIYLAGITPTPLGRFGEKRKDLSKVALGAEESVPWKVVSDVLSFLDEKKKEGFEIVALEQSKKSINYKNYKPQKPVLLIVGNEVGGVSEDVLSVCDRVIEIPQYGKKESLNVSVATGIALFSLSDAH